MDIDTYELKRDIVRRSTFILAVCCMMTLLFAIFILACRLMSIMEESSMDTIIISVGVYLAGIITGVCGISFISIRCIDNETEYAEHTDGHIHQED